MDQIERAIAVASESPVERHFMVELTFQSTGRHARVFVPVDMTEQENLDLVGWLGSSLQAWLAAKRAEVAKGLVVATQMPDARLV